MRGFVFNLEFLKLIKGPRVTLSFSICPMGLLGSRARMWVHSVGASEWFSLKSFFSLRLCLNRLWGCWLASKDIFIPLLQDWGGFLLLLLVLMRH